MPPALRGEFRVQMCKWLGRRDPRALRARQQRRVVESSAPPEPATRRSIAIAALSLTKETAMPSPRSPVGSRALVLLWLASTLAASTISPAAGARTNRRLQEWQASGQASGQASAEASSPFSTSAASASAQAQAEGDAGSTFAQLGACEGNADSCLLRCKASHSPARPANRHALAPLLQMPSPAPPHHHQLPTWHHRRRLLLALASPQLPSCSWDRSCPPPVRLATSSPSRHQPS
jgi:hypothetical protein